MLSDFFSGPAMADRKRLWLRGGVHYRDAVVNTHFFVQPDKISYITFLILEYD